MRCSVAIVVFPNAPKEMREFATMKEAQTFAFHKRASLKGQFYTITISPSTQLDVALEILIGKVYRGIHGQNG